MKDDFAKMLSMARKAAGFTQEQAAEELNVAVRTLSAYEQGKFLTDDMVAHMVQVYRSPALGYAYLSTQSATGRLLLPRIRIVGISSGAMQLRVTMKRAEHIYDLLEEICCDDQITLSEEAQFCKCIETLDDLVSTILAVKVLPRNAQKNGHRGCRHSVRKLGSV